MEIMGSVLTGVSWHFAHFSGAADVIGDWDKRAPLRALAGTYERACAAIPEVTTEQQARPVLPITCACSPAYLFPPLPILTIVTSSNPITIAILSNNVVSPQNCE